MRADRRGGVAFEVDGPEGPGDRLPPRISPVILPSCPFPLPPRHTLSGVDAAPGAKFKFSIRVSATALVFDLADKLRKMLSSSGNNSRLLSMSESSIVPATK